MSKSSRSADSDRRGSSSDEHALEAALSALDAHAHREWRSLRRLAPEVRLERLRVPLDLVLSEDADRPARLRRFLQDLRHELRESLLASAAFQRGRLFCLRCESSLCEHSLPPSERHVFVGYGQTGRPEWSRFDEWLSARGDPRVDRLFGRGRDLLAVAMPRKEVYSQLLHGFEAVQNRFLVLAQCCFGFFPVETGNGPAAMALTLQLVRTVDREGEGVAGVHWIGKLPEGARSALDEDLLPGLATALRPLRRELGAAARGRGRRTHPVPSQGIALERFANRCLQLVRDLCRDLEHRRRTDRRRTRHAKDRATQADRPTDKALAEALAVTAEQLFEDRQKKTFIVLGARNRVHVFTPAGRHVTSARYEGTEIRHRIERRRWVPCDGERFEEFRQTLAQVAQHDGEPS